MGIDPGTRTLGMAALFINDDGVIRNMELATFYIDKDNAFSFDPEDVESRFKRIAFIIDSAMKYYSPYIVGTEKVLFNKMSAVGFETALMGSKIIQRTCMANVELEQVYAFTPSDIKRSVGVSGTEKNKNVILRGAINSYVLKPFEEMLYKASDHEVDAAIMAKLAYLKTIGLF